MTTRKEISLSGVAGTETTVEVGGTEILIEKSPDNTPDGVPELVFDTPGSPVIPAYNQSRFRPPDGFDRFYVRDNGGTSGTLYITVVTDPRFQFRLAATVA